MTVETLWKEIEDLNRRFDELGVVRSVDYEKYYLYALIAHSTAIEGSTLTETETQLLLDEGLTAAGKPLVDHLMNEDLKKAYDFAREEARHLTSITPAFLKKLNALVMKSTGAVHDTLGGTFDSSLGEFRRCGVTAGVGGRSYLAYTKISGRTDELCALLEARIRNTFSFRGQYELSFNAHLNLVTIHPWIDGNGRTSRLLMNYLQFCYGLFPVKVFKEDREAYILSLRQAQDEEENHCFLTFMAGQLRKTLLLEIENANRSERKGFCLMF